MEAFIQDLDLKLTYKASYLIQPSGPTERRSMFLSNIDQSFNFHVKCVLFFSANPKLHLSSIVDRFGLALGKLVVPYDFVAGRLKVDAESGRLEIGCNGAGVSLVVASSGVMLEDLGELCPTNPAAKRLVPMPELEDQLKDQPLLAFQVTCFKCGSFAFGISVNHATLDGTAAFHLLHNLSALLSDKPLPIPPYTDRTILAVGSLPRVTYPHPHLITLDNIQRLPIAATPILKLNNKFNSELEFKEFHLNPKHISFLKADARNMHTTSFAVMVAHLWRSKALATTNDHNTTSSLIITVDMRTSPRPLLPLSYAGNGILPAYATATCHELEVGPFSRIVKMVGEGIGRMSNDEYVRSMVDCGMEKGFPMGDVFVTSWRRFAIEEFDFHCGKPKFFCRLPMIGSEIIILYSGKEKGSMTALVGLPSDCMAKFQDLFFKPFIHLQPRL